MEFVRIVRRRRFRKLRSGRIARPAGAVLLAVAAVLFAAAGFVLILPLPAPEPVLTLGSRPAGARFYDRSGRLLGVAGSARAAESRWYELGIASDDCVAAAFLAARNLSEADIRSADVLDVPRAMADALLGAQNPAAEAAAELIAMNGREPGAWHVSRLAGALAARYDRKSIAEWIINVRLYGNGTVGIDDAALAYYRVHAGGLTAARCAALEALAGDPGLSKNRGEFRNARNAILNRMFNGGFLEQKEWERAVAEEILPADFAGAEDAAVFDGQLPILDSYLQLAVDRLADRFPGRELPRADIRVYTALDLDFELQLICTAQNLLAPPDAEAGALPTLEGTSCDMAALLGPAPAAAALPEDLALAVIDPANGEVLAYFDSARGGESVARGRAGTALFPFVYLSAFTRGFSPASMLLDIPRADSAENPDGPYLGPVTARTALRERALAATAGMASRIGTDQIERTLALLGLADGEEAALSFERQMDRTVDLLSVSRAYASLAGGGLETTDAESGQPAAILRVEQDGSTPPESYEGRRTRRIFASDLAFLLQDILSNTSGRSDLDAPALAPWRSAVAAMLAEDSAGESAWAFAFTPSFVVGVRTRGYAGGPADPRPAWNLAQAAAGWALRSLPVQTWTEPPGIVRREVCVPSGLLPSGYCPNVASEVFLAGNEPSQIDSCYRPVAVNRESGRLATLWTPLNLIEENVYFILEGDALAWAERSGYPVPPASYDTLPETFPYFDDLHFTQPAALELLRGKVVLRGTAAASGMELYRMQAGPGLYPTVWYTLGSGQAPVREGELAQWDTSGADGVWSVQLTAVFQDGKIRTVAIPITLDNTPPAIRWILPSASMNLSLREGEPVVLQVEVTDNLELAGVDFYWDGTLRTRLQVGPFSVRWPASAPGPHTARICAQDRAGNETCTRDVEVEIGLKING